jgi:hypothetical protein
VTIGSALLLQHMLHAGAAIAATATIAAIAITAVTTAIVPWIVEAKDAWVDGNTLLGCLR